MSEKSEEHSYQFEADYVQVKTGDTTSDAETNVCISAFVTRQLQRLRADAIPRSAEKEAPKEARRAAWDDLYISHIVSLFVPEVLSLEFQLFSHSTLAAHPNTVTRALNFRLQPSIELELSDVFNPRADYLEALSRYCVTDIREQQMKRHHDPATQAEVLKGTFDDWILSGAGPEASNFEKFSIRERGIAVHFDPYQVACYAEGKYEVSRPQQAGDLVGALAEARRRELVEDGKRCGAADGVAAEGAAEPARMHRVHDRGPSGDGRAAIRRRASSRRRAPRAPAPVCV